MQRNIGHQRDGNWFVFDEKGKTLVKDLNSRKQAEQWVSSNSLRVEDRKK